LLELQQHSPKHQGAKDLTDLVNVKLLPHSNAAVRDTATPPGKPEVSHAPPATNHPQLLNFDDQLEEDLFQSLAFDREQSDDAVDLFS
jgi:hypothetical protein